MENFNNLIMTGSFVGQYELINFASKFNINIRIYKLIDISDDQSKYKFQYETIISDQTNYNIYNPFLPILLIGWRNENHYELLMPKNLNVHEFPEEHVINNINEIYNNSNININTNKENKKENDSNKLNSKYEYELKHYIENKDSIYPALKGCLSASTKLEDIFNYLNSSNSKKKTSQNLLIMQ